MIKTIVWNVAWNKSRWQRDFVHDLFRAESPGLVCLTEAAGMVVPRYPNTLASARDCGYPNPNGAKRKVWLFSDSPWEESTIHRAELTALPPGRFVSAVTKGIRMVGVCIPWRFAHVRNGHRNREPWQDHDAYVAALGSILARYRQELRPVCVLGDFNLALSGTPPFGPREQRLRDAMGGLSFPTGGLRDADQEQLIDHVATSPGCEFTVEQTLSRQTSDGRKVSDHPAIFGQLLHCRSGQEPMNGW